MQTILKPISSRLSAFFVAALVTASAVPPVEAQVPDQPLTPETWSVTPSLGFGFGGDVDGGAFGLGVAAGYNFNPRVRFEGDFAILPSAEQGVLVDIDTTVWTLTANAQYHFDTDGPTFPYVLAGIGFGRGSTDLEELDPRLVQLGLDESSTEFVFQVGAGVNYRMSERTSVRGDLRYSTGDGLVPDFVRLFAGVTFNLGRTVP